MRSAVRRSPDGGRAPGAIGHLNGTIVQSLSIAAISAGLLWLLWIYGSSLRDPRYLDGWVLACGMTLQLAFHVTIKTASLSPKSTMRFRKTHIFFGYLLIGVFVSHLDFSLPDTGFEWALWACFVLVAVSGIFGTYLTWTLKAKRGIDERVGYDRISRRCTELAGEVQAAVNKTDPQAALIALPSPPYDAWILDLYANHLKSFFERPCNITAHLIGSRHPLKRLTGEINSLSRYVDQPGKEKLAAINILVMEKDQLDFARVYLGLTKGWLFVHVPFTYALIVLTILHVLIVYAFSSGAG